MYAMFYLAQKYGQGPQPLKAVAEQQRMPEQYLEQLLGHLRREGLVRTVRGAQGGYQLADAPENITVGAVIHALEGPVVLSDCIAREDTCPQCGACATRAVWARMTEGINDVMAGITLKDMLQDGALADV